MSPTTPTVINNPPVAQKTGHTPPPKRVIISLAITVLIIIAAIIGAVYHHGHQKPKTAAPAFSFNYTSLDSFKLASSKTGSGISFSKPVEIGQGFKAPAGINQYHLSQQTVKNGQELAIASIDVSVAPGPITAYQKKLVEVIGNSKDKTYSLALKSLQTYVSARVDPRYSATMGAPKSFVNGNIKNDSWVASFSATPKAAASAANLPKLEGQVVLAVDNNGIYYFMDQTVGYNWTGNQNVWNQVNNSLKIDQ